MARAAWPGLLVLRVAAAAPHLLAASPRLRVVGELVALLAPDKEELRLLEAVLLCRAGQPAQTYNKWFFFLRGKNTLCFYCQISKME